MCSFVLLTSSPLIWGRGLVPIFIHSVATLFLCVSSVCPPGRLLVTCLERGVGTALVWHLLLPALPKPLSKSLHSSPRALRPESKLPPRAPRPSAGSPSPSWPCDPGERPPGVQGPRRLVLAHRCPPAWRVPHPPYLASSIIQGACVSGLSLWLRRTITRSLGPWTSHGHACRLWLGSPGSGRKGRPLPLAGMGTHTSQLASQARAGQAWGGEGAGLSGSDGHCPSLAFISRSSAQVMKLAIFGPLVHTLDVVCHHSVSLLPFKPTDSPSPKPPFPPAL